MAAYPRQYLEFIKLFNQGCFFEAHEALELLWRQEKGPARNFYHGLIQIAAVFVHLTRFLKFRGPVSPAGGFAENRGPQKSVPEGAKCLLETSRKYLEPYGAVYAGLDVRKILSDTEAAVTAGALAPVLTLH